MLKTLKKEKSVFLEAPEFWGVESLKAQEMVIRIVAWVNEEDIYHAQRLINRAVKLKLQEMDVWG